MREWIRALLFVGAVFCPSATVYAFEITGISVFRGGQGEATFDRLTADLFLEEGEAVTVDWVAFGEDVKGGALETLRWIPLEFRVAEGNPDAGKPTYSLATPQAISSPRGQGPRALQTFLDYPTKHFGPEATRAHAYIRYAVRVYRQGAGVESAAYYYSDAYLIGEATPAATPKENYVPRRTLGNLAQGTQRERLADGWVIDLPAIPVPEDGGGAQQTPLTKEQIEALQALADKLDTERLQAARKALASRVLVSDSKHNEHIYFFTNRMRFPERETKERWYGGFDFLAGVNGGYRAHSIHTGWTEVYVPKSAREKGRLSSPRGLPGPWGDEAFAITGKHALWEKKEVSHLLNQLWDKPVLIYLHGFNNDFNEAIVRAAQIKADMAWNGEVLALDWPSVGRTAAYASDREIAESDRLNHQTIGWLLQGLTLENPAEGRPLRTRGARHVLCHSMGNEIFNRTTKYLAEETAALQPGLFKNLIFAAPDVYVGDFSEMIERLRARGVAEKYTLYYSRRDAAVNSSRFVNFFDLGNLLRPGELREFVRGRAGVTPRYYPGVDIINTDLVNEPGLGGLFLDFRHGYFASSDRVLEDIQILIKTGLPAQARQSTLMSERETFAEAAHYLVRP